MRQGGRKGADYSKKYERLVPRSTEDLLSQCSSILKRNRSRDLEVNRSDFPGASPLSFRREASKAIRMPHTKEIYLSITPEFFRQQISKALGNILDCYVGVTKDGDQIFQSLKVDRNTHDQDSSDEELDNVSSEYDEAFQEETWYGSALHE